MVTAGDFCVLNTYGLPPAFILTQHSGIHSQHPTTSDSTPLFTHKLSRLHPRFTSPSVCRAGIRMMSTFAYVNTKTSPQTSQQSKTPSQSYRERSGVSLHKHLSNGVSDVQRQRGVRQTEAQWRGLSDMIHAPVKGGPRVREEQTGCPCDHG